MSNGEHWERYAVPPEPIVLMEALVAIIREAREDHCALLRAAWEGMNHDN